MDGLPKIAIIEDEIYMREELTDMLGKSGYDPVPITDFENAPAQIRALSPDLVLLDINLPGPSGFEICKAIQSGFSGSILVLTARDRLEDELHALGLGVAAGDELPDRDPHELDRRKGQDGNRLLYGRVDDVFHPLFHIAFHRALYSLLLKYSGDKFRPFFRLLLYQICRKTSYRNLRILAIMNHPFLPPECSRSGREIPAGAAV